VAIEFILLVIGAYLLGSVPAAYLVARWFRGIDLRQYGSGNVGMSNLWKFTSGRLTIPVIIFDLGKGAVAVLVAQLLGMEQYQQVAVGVAAIIGHNWPVFLRFSGGRGILTVLGVILILPSINSLVPWGAIVGLAIAAIGVFVIHNPPVGVLIGVVAVPLVSCGFAEPFPFTLGFLAIFLITVTRRLTAPRTSLSASVSLGQLFVNRLLFDRDIRDSEAWIHRVPPEQQEKQGKV